jgi:hypothetical protein
MLSLLMSSSNSQIRRSVSNVVGIVDFPSSQPGAPVYRRGNVLMVKHAPCVTQCAIAFARP